MHVSFDAPHTETETAISVSVRLLRLAMTMVAALWFVRPLPVLADTQTAAQREQASRALLTGNLLQAEKYLTEAIETARQERLRDERRAVIMGELATVKEKEQQFRAAIALLKPALALTEHALWKSHPDALRFRRRLAELYIADRNYKSAADTLSAQISALSAERLEEAELSDCLRMLAESMLGMGNPAGAIVPYQKLLAMQLESSKKQAQAGDTLYQIGQCHIKQRQWNEAAQCFARAAVVDRSAASARPLVAAERLYFQAHALAAQNKFAPAQRAYAQALALYRQTGGENAKYVNCMQASAIAYGNAGEYARAHSQFAQVMGWQRRHRETTSVPLAATLSYEANVYLREHKFDEAVKIYRQILQLLAAEKQEAHPLYAAAASKLHELESNH